MQLTWQVDNGWFLPVFYNFFMEFINIGPVYIRGGQEGHEGGVGGGKSLTLKSARAGKLALMRMPLYKPS